MVRCVAVALALALGICSFAYGQSGSAKAQAKAKKSAGTVDTSSSKAQSELAELAELEGGGAGVGEEAAEVAPALSSRNIITRALHGGPVVFSVLVILLILSLLSWALLFYKVLVLRIVASTSQRFLQRFWDHSSLNDLFSKMEDFPASPIKSVFLAGYEELMNCDLAESSSQLAVSEIKQLMILQVALDNIGRSMKKAKMKAKKRLESLLILLAISASSAPFVGLLGTVWGIMNSFEQIAATGSSSLAVVAPGVSEALIATAFGLMAAIPAVVGYNISQHSIKETLGYVDEFTGEYLNIVERFIFDKFYQTSEAGKLPTG